MASVAPTRAATFPPRRRRRVSFQDLTVMTRQLASLVGGGLTLMQAIDALIEHTENERLAIALRQVREELRGGGTFAEALAKHPRLFSPLYVSIVRAGEVSGELPRILNWLADYMEREQTRRTEADKQQIIEEIRRLYREGRIEELSGAWRYHLTLFRKARHRFGSWRAAIEAAGLNYEEVVSRRKWTKESILREIQRLYAEGKDLSVTAMQRHYPNLLAIAQSPRYFGSWQAAIEAAGLDYELIKRQRGRRRREPLRVKVTAE